MTQNDQNFETIMGRPADYFRRSAEDQWAYDKHHRLLDVEVDVRLLSQEQKDRFNAKYRMKLK